MIRTGQSHEQILAKWLRFRVCRLYRSPKQGGVAVDGLRQSPNEQGARLPSLSLNIALDSRQQGCEALPHYI